ncbi:Clavaminate synthase-like protein [Amniculicola lignicola CBS 123094]|uniref:Clavaminate synthase-like protein n=1 Tax=Amniculicola lignicola CBS 123094 TaxID=1392246 RepID=A0A6A5W2N4_9PLEO|nr:Clavaminate synthase-like protein [Amniculicola lignicola CBS 123094]
MLKISTINQNATSSTYCNFIFHYSSAICNNRSFSSTTFPIPRTIEVPKLSYSEQLDHINQVSNELERTGALKITLGFHDERSKYLQVLLRGLHHHHGHNLPIPHSATVGSWYWDVRPKKEKFGTLDHQARSETMDQFPWHTDCSYEHDPPQYFALQVLQHDRCGGGTLSIMNAQRLIQHLSPETQSALAAKEYRICTPPEFVRNPNMTHIVGSVLSVTPTHKSEPLIRFREDIFTPLTDQAARALVELKNTLGTKEVREQATLHLEAGNLPKGSIILVDNRRWLHARNVIRDPERHLRRVRWHACPFTS